MYSRFFTFLYPSWIVNKFIVGPVLLKKKFDKKKLSDENHKSSSARLRDISPIFLPKPELTPCHKCNIPFQLNLCHQFLQFYWWKQWVLVSKMNSELEHPFHKIGCPYWSAECSKYLYYITENRLRDARGPVQISSSPLHLFPHLLLLTFGKNSPKGKIVSKMRFFWNLAKISASSKILKKLCCYPKQA